MAITMQTVKAAKYRGKRGSHDVRWDDQVTGFGLRIFPSGKRSYVVRYRTGSGRSRLHTIGAADRWTLDAARKKAKKILVDVDEGGDPQADRQRERQSVTVADFFDVFLDRHVKHHKSRKETTRRLDVVARKVGKLALADLTTADLASIHTAIGKRGKVEANRTLTAVVTALNRAIEWGYLDGPNVAAKVKRFPEHSRERFLTKNELPRVLTAIEDHVEHPYVKAALLLIILTGLRKTECLGLEWEHVDLDNRLLRVPKTKTGKGRTVPLSNSALRLLDGLPREAESPYVLPGRRAGSHLSRALVERTWREVRKLAGVEDVTIHDLRRTAGSHLAMAGVGLPIVGQILGHSSLTATSIYARLQPDAGRQAIEEYGDMLDGMAVTGGGRGA